MCPIVSPEGKFLFFAEYGKMFCADAKVIEEFKQDDKIDSGGCDEKLQDHFFSFVPIHNVFFLRAEVVFRPEGRG